MKRYVFILAPALLALALVACDSGVAPDAEAEALAAAKGKWGRTNGAVTVPFKSRFFSNGGTRPDPRCGEAPPDGPYLLNTQDGFGEATHLGRFTFHAEFCQDITDFLDDGQLTEGESVPYFDGFAIFTAANGDELWVENVTGAVLPSDHPDYDFEFADPFEFTGGTGRFEGAGGGGVTNSFTDASTGRVDHDWSGTLTLLRGK